MGRNGRTRRSIGFPVSPARRGKNKVGWFYSKNAGLTVDVQHDWLSGIRWWRYIYERWGFLDNYPKLKRLASSSIIDLFATRTISYVTDTNHDEFFAGTVSLWFNNCFDLVFSYVTESENCIDNMNYSKMYENPSKHFSRTHFSSIHRPTRFGCGKIENAVWNGIGIAPAGKMQVN